MSSEIGKRLKISVFGQSHGKAVGVNIDGLPAGELIDMDELMHFMGRRRPGKDAVSTARSEQDVPIFLSGVLNGMTCASPLCAIIENNDTRSSDYSEFFDSPRPSHADYTARIKWGDKADMRGGGHFSGRMTAPLCIAGGIAKQLLARRGIFIGAHLASIGGISDSLFPLWPEKQLFDEIALKAFPVIDDEKGYLMQETILQAAKASDSVGGAVECAVIGLPSGLGTPMFDGIENRLAAAVFGIPAVKGIEFGAGFACTAMKGSECNDPFCIGENETLATETNNSGGILGGITNGMPLVFRIAIKPTPSIGLPQKTVCLSRMEQTTLTIKGRHDPCIAHRAVPVLEAVTAIVILDTLLEEGF
ncbi:MAG: chorismate synthase [Clostridiales bacterium]|nr:chorismate synthase [Clostridiales bacterium]